MDNKATESALAPQAKQHFRVASVSLQTNKIEDPHEQIVHPGEQTPHESSDDGESLFGHRPVVSSKIQVFKFHHVDKSSLNLYKLDG